MMQFHDSTWRAFLDGLRDSAEFRSAWSRTIADLPHPAVRWETCAVSAATLDRRFESIFLPSPALARVLADPQPFAQQLRDVAQVATFENLGGDAVLVVPAVTGDYPHLVAFARSAPAEQVDALWRAVGEAMCDRLANSTRPVWLNTAGLGVSWLHVRLDARPKYYGHAPFRGEP